VAVQFVVERAGCSSCAELIGEALGVIGKVEQVDIDESSDIALVRLSVSGDVDVDEVDRVLHLASKGSGHAYRVRPGSLVSASA
jgi:hypothetical protein